MSGKAKTTARSKPKPGGVRFAEECDVHEFDKRDAPSANIYDVVPKSRGHTDDADAVPQPRVLSSPFVVAKPIFDGRAPPTPQKWGVHQIEGQMSEEFDTETMTVAELKEALSARGLSTKGKKAELKQRLENDIVKEQLGKTPPPKQQTSAKATADAVPEWLQWE